MSSRQSYFSLKLSASKSLLRLNRKSDKDKQSPLRQQSGSAEDISQPIKLSEVNYLRKPKGPAPIASVDSVLELPLLTSASCSTLNTLNNDR